MIEPRQVGAGVYARWFIDDMCSDCKRQMELEAQRIREVKRESNSRRERTAKIRNNIKNKIPLLFRYARITKIKKQLADIMLDDHSVFLWGSVGTGKTYASLAALRVDILRNKCAERTVFESLLSKIQAENFSEDSILKKYLNADVLILDDIGLRDTEFARRILFRIIDTRMEQNLKTVLISNLSPENLKKNMGERIFSRLQTYRIVKLTGNDKRKLKRA